MAKSLADINREMNAKKRNRKMGRPSKYDTLDMEMAERMYKARCTDAQVAAALGVTEETINNWKKADPDFFKAIKDWRTNANGVVERSLLERATGYQCIEQKALVVNGEVKVVDLVKQYPPDTAAAFIWLKNRDKERWRDKQEVDHKFPDAIMAKLVD